MVDFSKLERAGTWPFRVGGVMVHSSWFYMEDALIRNAAINVIELLPNEQIRCTSGGGGNPYKYTYSKSSFDPIDDWYYLNSRVKREKKGFGKWFSERSNE